MSQYKEIAQKLKTEGYQFELSSYLGEGWKLGTSMVGYFILYALVSFAISSAAGLIPFVGPLAHYIVLAPVLSGGLILFINNRYLSGKSNFSMVFDGFKNMGPIILTNFLVFVFTMLAFVPIGIGFFEIISGEMISALMANDGATMQSFGQDLIANFGTMFIYIFLSMILVLIVGVLLQFSLYFVVIGKLNAIDAMKSSVAVVQRKFFSFIGFMIVLGLINILGLLALGIGLIFTMSMTVAAMYLAFNKIVMSQAVDGEVLLTEDDILDA